MISDNELIALLDDLDAAKAKATATEPPYYVATDRADDCPQHRNSGLALVDTGRSGDWPVARLCEWPTAEFVTAVCNAYPTLSAALRERLGKPQTDGLPCCPWCKAPATSTEGDSPGFWAVYCSMGQAGGCDVAPHTGWLRSRDRTEAIWRQCASSPSSLAGEVTSPSRGNCRHNIPVCEACLINGV